jgi:hypothetical protein
MSTANAELKRPTGVGSSEFGRTPLTGWVPVAQPETAFKKSSRSSRSEVATTEVKKDSRHYIIFSVDRPGFIGVSLRRFHVWRLFWRNITTKQ